MWYVSNYFILLSWNHFVSSVYHAYNEIWQVLLVFPPFFFLVFYYSYIVFNSIEWHFPPQSGSCISYKLTFYHFSITMSSSVFISLVWRIWKSINVQVCTCFESTCLSLHKKNMFTSFFRTVQRISGWKSNEILKYQNFFQKNVLALRNMSVIKARPCIHFQAIGERVVLKTTKGILRYELVFC